MKLVATVLFLLSLVPSSPAARTRSARPTRATSAQRAETYESVTIDSNGSLRITTSGHGDIVVPRDGELATFGKQTAFAKPILSPGRTAVGAQAEYGNCCTSYDVPLELVVYARGRVHRFRGIELPIFRWHFADAGTRVAYRQEAVHFSCESHYELRDIDSERLIDSADVPEPCGQVPNPPPVKIPNWVSALLVATSR
jgi:hypothetical protein